MFHRQHSGVIQSKKLLSPTYLLTLQRTLCAAVTLISDFTVGFFLDVDALSARKSDEHNKCSHTKSLKRRSSHPGGITMHGWIWHMEVATYMLETGDDMRQTHHTLKI